MAAAFWSVRQHSTAAAALLFRRSQWAGHCMRSRIQLASASTIIDAWTGRRAPFPCMARASDPLPTDGRQYVLVEAQACSRCFWSHPPLLATYASLNPASYVVATWQLLSGDLETIHLLPVPRTTTFYYLAARSLLFFTRSGTTHEAVLQLMIDTLLVISRRQQDVFLVFGCVGQCAFLKSEGKVNLVSCIPLTVTNIYTLNGRLTFNNTPFSTC